MGHFRKHLVPSSQLPDKVRTSSVMLLFCTLLSALCLLPATVAGAMDLADEPLIVQSKPPPANIMIGMDDSGSMTFEFLVDGYYEGRFNKPNATESSSYAYIYDYLGDNAYEIDGWYLESEGRLYWQSQWYGKNALYYNPNNLYKPWPNHAGRTFSNADINTPAPHPIYDSDYDNLDLDAGSFSVVATGGPNTEVNHAHYYVKDNNNNVLSLIHI